MPPILVVFWTILGLCSARALTDHIPHNPNPKPEKAQYLVWTAPQWNAVADVSGHCDLTWFAVVTQQEKALLIIGEEDRGVDWSWHFYFREKADRRAQIRFRFIDPSTGKTLSDQTIGVNCWPYTGPNYDSNLYKPDGTLRGYEE